VISTTDAATWAIAALATFDLSQKVVLMTTPILSYGSDEIGQTAAEIFRHRGRGVHVRTTQSGKQ